jgi:hypothetical protein
VESAAGIEQPGKMNGSPGTLSNDAATLIVTVILIFTLYWSIRGFIQLFQRHNSILVIFYLVFLFPIAYCHMLLLGIFGSSKRQRFLKEAEAEAKRQLEVDRIKTRGKS